MSDDVAARTRWLVQDRFGLFIHWGIYASAARHEWVKSREKLTDEQYQRYFDHFDPDLYDPAEWAETAWAAGMRYVVVTTKHHDGFCLWDSALTDYKVTNTPYGRDLLGPLVSALRERGFRIGFYHSLLDWHHPEFPVDLYHPQRDDADFIAAHAGRGRREVRRPAARPGTRAADELRPDRRPVVRLLVPGARVQREGSRRVAVRAVARDGARTAAGHHREQPARPRRG